MNTVYWTKSCIRCVLFFLPQMPMMQQMGGFPQGARMPPNLPPTQVSPSRPLLQQPLLPPGTGDSPALIPPGSAAVTPTPAMGVAAGSTLQGGMAPQSLLGSQANQNVAAPSQPVVTSQATTPSQGSAASMGGAASQGGVANPADVAAQTTASSQSTSTASEAAATSSPAMEQKKGEEVKKKKRRKKKVSRT